MRYNPPRAGEVDWFVAVQLGGHKLRERFDEKVDKRAPNECWPWKASLSDLGYGSFSVNLSAPGQKGRMQRKGAHQVAYVLANGPHDERLKTHDIAHTCDMRWCVNPAHLKLMTHRENITMISGRANPYDALRERLAFLEHAIMRCPTCANALDQAPGVERYSTTKWRETNPRP